MEYIPFARSSSITIGVKVSDEISHVLMGGASFEVCDSVPEALLALTAVHAIRDSKDQEIVPLTDNRQHGMGNDLTIGSIALREIEGAKDVIQDLNTVFGFYPEIRKIHRIQIEQEQGSAPARKDFEEYLTTLKKIPELTEDMLEILDTYCHITLPENSGGYEIASKVISEIKDNKKYLTGMARMLGDLALSSRESVRAFMYVRESMVRDRSVNIEKVKALAALAETLKSDYEALKGCLLDFFIMTYSAYTLDRVFKSSIRTSVSWFVPANIVQDFNDMFESLLQHMSSMEFFDARMRASLQWISNTIGK